jgi:hypothetical protein
LQSLAPAEFDTAIEHLAHHNHLQKRGTLPHRKHKVRVRPFPLVLVGRPAN